MEVSRERGCYGMQSESRSLPRRIEIYCVFLVMFHVMMAECAVLVAEVLHSLFSFGKDVSLLFLCVRSVCLRSGVEVSYHVRDKEVLTESKVLIFILSLFCILGGQKKKKRGGQGFYPFFSIMC